MMAVSAARVSELVTRVNAAVIVMSNCFMMLTLIESASLSMWRCGDPAVATPGLIGDTSPHEDERDRGALPGISCACDRGGPGG
jgi:hypothetical protein